MTPQDDAPSMWRPGLPVETPADFATWQAWRKARTREGQRLRRRRLRRIDYYPSPEAAAIIDAARSPAPGGDYSTVIDRLILAAVVADLPE
jgi:hypothetical protein